MTPYEHDLQMLRLFKVKRDRAFIADIVGRTRLRNLYHFDSILPPIATMQEQGNPRNTAQIIVERFNNWK